MKCEKCNEDFSIPWPRFYYGHKEGGDTKWFVSCPNGHEKEITYKFLDGSTMIIDTTK